MNKFKILIISTISVFILLECQDTREGKGTPTALSQHSLHIVLFNTAYLCCRPHFGHIFTPFVNTYENLKSTSKPLR